MKLPKLSEFEVERLGPCRYTSPATARQMPFVADDDLVLATSDVKLLEPYYTTGELPPTFERAGPRKELFFNPDQLSCGIVTCGGLCPGLNDVIRSVVMTLHYVYGVRRIVGFRYGYAGLSAKPPEAPLMLAPDKVDRAHEDGGTLLGSSRGAQDPAEMVDTLVNWKVGILIAIGGDGTLRGASKIAAEIKRRNLPISVIGIPKTIDNDIAWIDRSFGFLTAVEEARPAIVAANAEAKGALNGIGVVKLMGRHSGFIAGRASLANPDVNFCLIPEEPFTLEGRGGFLEVLRDRLERRHHAVIVVAEGAGQDLLAGAGQQETDKSGNVKLKDIGPFLCDEIKRYCAGHNIETAIKYIDPSYIIRSQPSNSNDSSYCLVLGQNAVHAGMAGRTNMVVGFRAGVFTNMPIKLATGARKQVDPKGEEWRYLLHMTGQPASMVGKSEGE